jgi:hypothetical protein
MSYFSVSIVVLAKAFEAVSYVTCHLVEDKDWHYQPKVQKTLNAISLDFGLYHELATMMSVLGLYYKESKFEQEVKDGASYETELRQGRLERVDCKGDTPTDESLW